MALSIPQDQGDPDAALSVWVAEQQEVMGETPAFQSLLFLRHPDIQRDVRATSCLVCASQWSVESTLANGCILSREAVAACSRG